MSGDPSQPPRPPISRAIQNGTDLIMALIEQEKNQVAQEYQQQIRDLQDQLAKLNTTASPPSTDFSQLNVSPKTKSEGTLSPVTAAPAPLGLDPVSIINVMKTSLEASQRSAQDWETRYNEIKQERDRLRASSQAIVVTLSQKIDALRGEVARLQALQKPGTERKSISLEPTECKPIASVNSLPQGPDVSIETTSQILPSDQELELPHGAQKRARSTSSNEIPCKLQKTDDGMPKPTWDTPSNP